jgi:hypothetical protein
MSAIESVLVENRVFPPAEASVKAARISGMDAYNALCNEAAADFEGFWARLARENVVWTKPFTRTLDESNAPFYKWFDDGELNARPTAWTSTWARRSRTRPPSSLKPMTARSPKSPTRNCWPREPVCQRAQGPGHQKGDRV